MLMSGLPLQECFQYDCESIFLPFFPHGCEFRDLFPKWLPQACVSNGGTEDRESTQVPDADGCQCLLTDEAEAQPSMLAGMEMADKRDLDEELCTSAGNQASTFSLTALAYGPKDIRKGNGIRRRPAHLWVRNPHPF